MRLALAVGGSAGHIYPALAVVEELREMVPELEVFWIGRPRSIEEEIVSQERGIAYIPLRSSGIPRGSPLKGAGTLLRLPAGVWRAAGLLEGIRPDVLLCMGGYTSFAPAVAAHLLRIPVVIHEQNVSLGLANRVIARFARRVLLSFPETLAEVPWRDRARVTGIPVRRGIVACRAPYTGRGYLLVLGGSLGSRLLVEALRDAAPLLARLRGFRVWISVGRFGDPDGVARELAAAGIPGVKVSPWIRDMAGAYAGARLVVSRAGASTVGEVLAAGRPGILVPWGGAAGGHQEANARAVAARGGGIVLLEEEVREGRLGDLIASLWDDTAALRSLAARARELARPNAAREVARELIWAAEGIKWTVPACTS